MIKIGQYIDTIRSQDKRASLGSTRLTALSFALDVPVAAVTIPDWTQIATFDGDLLVVDYGGYTWPAYQPVVPSVVEAIRTWCADHPAKIALCWCVFPPAHYQEDFVPAGVPANLWFYHDTNRAALDERLRQHYQERFFRDV